ncbi:hypothetical protein, partial [Mesorhizobium sp.]|uniref:hypothetical protein n=1 Tax=Mesorhizobium sp. TaxID=1871066 RepID=UPI0025804CF5
RNAALLASTEQARQLAPRDADWQSPATSASRVRDRVLVLVDHCAICSDMFYGHDAASAGDAERAMVRDPISSSW